MIFRLKTSQKFHSIKSIKNSNNNSSQKETTNNSIDKISEKDEFHDNQNCEIQRILEKLYIFVKHNYFLCKKVNKTYFLYENGTSKFLHR